MTSARPRRAGSPENLGLKLLHFAVESKRNLSLIQIRFFYSTFSSAARRVPGDRSASARSRWIKGFARSDAATK